MTCEIKYVLASGERKSETTSQICGSSKDLDDKEDQLKKAYSAYDSVEINCVRN